MKYKIIYKILKQNKKKIYRIIIVLIVLSSSCTLNRKITIYLNNF